MELFSVDTFAQNGQGRGERNVATPRQMSLTVPQQSDTSLFVDDLADGIDRGKLERPSLMATRWR